MLCIDLLNLRILSLLVCRGRPAEKASFLAALAILDYDSPVKKWNARIENALALIVHMSAVLPNKFLSVNKNDAVFVNILGFNFRQYGWNKKRKYAILD